MFNTLAGYAKIKIARFPSAVYVTLLAVTTIKKNVKTVVWRNTHIWGFQMSQHNVMALKMWCLN